MHEGIPVAVDNLDACINFYTEVLGLELLRRPKGLDKSGPGAWLGDEDDTVQFHLMANDNTLSPEKEHRLNRQVVTRLWKSRTLELSVIV